MSVQKHNELSKIYNELPTTPGVYIFRDEGKKVLYVGKAINLKSRVSSYFQNTNLLSPKTQALITKVTDIEHIKVDNELEALLLEAELIKRYRPPYNINLKDDKFYKFIKIEKDSTKTYRITTTRKKKEDKATYFGPYPESSSIQIILKLLRKVFPYRDCNVAKFNRYQKAKRPCLFGYIGVCPAPCQGEEQISLNKKNVNLITKYLNGDKKEIFKKLKTEMKKASHEQRYEEAAIIRDQINSYDYLTQNKRDILEYIKSPDISDIGKEQSLIDLIEILKSHGIIFSNPITKKNINSFRTETYDISNIQGKFAVGSMVVFIGGKSVKSEYRRFKIKTKDSPDDFHMMEEVLGRRFNSTQNDKKKWSSPDLIIVDGGKGQLSIAIEVLNSLSVNIPVISIAKKYETIIIHKNNQYIEINLPDSNKALNFIKNTRDEAHRFGINYYRKLHQKNLVSKN